MLSSSNLLEVGQCLILPKLLHQSCLLGWTDWCSTLRPSNFSDFGHFYSQKWPFWAQKSNFLTIDASSRPWWVEHWLNKVEHCPTHSGGSVWALRAPKKCHQGAPEASKLAVLAQKGHFLTIYASSRPKWVEQGCPFVSLGAPKMTILQARNAVLRDYLKLLKTIIFA